MATGIEGRCVLKQHEYLSVGRVKQEQGETYLNIIFLDCRFVLERRNVGNGRMQTSQSHLVLYGFSVSFLAAKSSSLSDTLEDLRSQVQHEGVPVLRCHLSLQDRRRNLDYHKSWNHMFPCMDMIYLCGISAIVVISISASSSRCTCVFQVVL